MSDQGPDWEQIEIESMEDRDRQRELRELRAEVEQLKRRVDSLYRDQLSSEAPMTTGGQPHISVVELDDTRLEIDTTPDGRVRIIERKPYDWTVRFAGITPDQAMEFARSLITAANQAKHR